jgi:hypothetical protein
MRATSPVPSEAEIGSVTTTARHMADAVGYLTRVANNAGLRGIAVKLTGVRTSLLKVVDAGAEDDGPAKTARVSDTSSKDDEGGHDDED